MLWVAREGVSFQFVLSATKEVKLSERESLGALREVCSSVPHLDVGVLTVGEIHFSVERFMHPCQL